MSQPAIDPAPALHLHGWSERVIVGVALCALASGFGQFGAVAALGDVARTFGQVHQGASLTDQAGLSGTEIGMGLAVIRLASIGALPLTGLADRFGRRRILLVTVAVGLAVTAATFVSPGYWWFVIMFAVGRPFLSASAALSQVVAAEQTASGQRARAVALVTAGYGLGAGLAAVIHSLASASLGFRGVFALAVVPLLGIPVMARWVTEPDRFAVAAAEGDHSMPVLGAVGSRYRTRLLALVGLSFALAVVTGPATTFVFLYAQNVRHLAGGLTAAMVVAAGVVGLGGLLVGRWLADRIGRRPTGAMGMVGIVLGATLTYSGSSLALVVGYVLGVLAGAVLAPAAGALINELFPTGVRASVAGWWLMAGVLGAVSGLLAFGAISDLGNRFSFAALVLFLPAASAVGLFWCVPETKGCEPEDLWPEG